MNDEVVLKEAGEEEVGYGVVQGHTLAVAGRGELHVVRLFIKNISKRGEKILKPKGRLTSRENYSRLYLIPYHELLARRHGQREVRKATKQEADD